MNKHLFATFLILSNLPFITTAHMQPSRLNPTKSKQISKTQLLKHLQNVKVTLQKHLRWMHDNWQNGMMYSGDYESPEVIQEEAEMNFFMNLTEDFYQNSIPLQQKISERISPTLTFICTHIQPLTIDEMSHHLLPYAKLKFDEDTTKQLSQVFFHLYTKHYRICRNNYPNVDLTHMPVNELFEQCVQMLIGIDELFLYNTRTLLEQLDIKIKELENA